MKLKRQIIFLTLLLAICSVALAQNKKLDKSLKKIDGYYNAGKFKKALSSLTKFKSGALKMGPNSSYMVTFYLREAKFNLGLGMLTTFESSLTNALNTSLAAYGENSTLYAKTMFDVADIYNQYGNYRIAREQTEKGRGLLTKSNQLTELIDAESALTLAEAMIGQGYCLDAIELLKSKEKFIASRAVDKESVVEDGKIQTKRVPEEEIYQRFDDYAKLKLLMGMAKGKMGNLSVSGIDVEEEGMFPSFDALANWLRTNRRFLGETSLTEINYRYVRSRIFVDNGGISFVKSEWEFDNILNDLKKRTSPTNELGNDLYLSQLEHLLKEESRARYLNLKLEYQKLVEKNYPKMSAHRVNMRAVEFDSKLSKEKTKDLETDALTVMNSKSLPKNYKTSLRILDFLLEISIAEKRYVNGETYLNQIVDVKKELCGENSPEHNLAKVRLANFYIDYTNKIEEAGKIYTDILFKQVMPQIKEQHIDLLPALNHAALWYEMTDNYAEALKTLDAARKAATIKFDDDDILYAVEMERIADLQMDLGSYDQAEKNIATALSVIGKKENKDMKEKNEVNVRILETQAKLFGIKGLFDEAENNLDRTRKIIKRSEVPIGDELSTAKELSSLFIQLGRYSETDKLLKLLITDYEKLFGPNSIRLIDPLVSKGKILLARGDYTEAEKIAIRANQIAIKTYGDNSTKTAPTQKLLSDIYYLLGDYEKAESNVVQAISSQEKQFGRRHIEVAKSISQLALIKFHKGDNRAQVEKLMTESRDIIADKLSKDNPVYAEVLKNMAVLYISQKKYDQAFNSLTIAEGIWRAKTGSKSNINAASIYALTGDVYYQQKNYKKAEDFYNQAKKLYEDYFSDKHPEYVKILSKLSKVYYMQKDYKRSKKMIEESLNNYENFIKQTFPALSERQKAKYWNTIKGDFEFYNTLAFSNLEDFKDLAGKVYNYQLLTKALLLSTSIKMRERILNSSDEELKNQFNDWVDKKEKLTLALSMSSAQLTENEIDPSALQQEVERIEKNLSQQSELFSQSFENKRITYDDVKKGLKPNEVAIEMVRYRNFNHSLTDSVIYAALYIRSDMPRPKVIIMNDGKKMESRYFKFYRNAITGKIEDPYSYKVFWEPVQKELGQASTIYLSPDGVYNQINLESIATPDGRYVIDNSNIVLVSNTKDLYLRKIQSRTAVKDNTAALFGNPSFYAATAGEHAVAQLPGTEKEVDQLQFMLKQKAYATTQYVGTSATEEHIKEQNSPGILHIATHGLYRPTEQITLEEEMEGNEAVLAQNPLMRTGLLLKGAGDLLVKTDRNYNMDSGILTAYEAQSLNLDKTEMVVLSACETGLGELEAGEGVFGLQRAFLNAGAKVLVMSMFKVDDDATQKLMLSFYYKWKTTGNLRQSFIDAKKELRVQYPEPIFWGAFMMIGLD